jgi:hypothetical protein
MSDTLTTLTVCACAKHVLDPPSETIIVPSTECHSYGECIVTSTKFTSRSSSQALRDFPNATEIPCSVCGAAVLYHYKGEMTTARRDEIAATLICTAKCSHTHP